VSKHAKLGSIRSVTTTTTQRTKSERNYERTTKCKRAENVAPENLARSSTIARNFSSLQRARSSAVWRYCVDRVDRDVGCAKDVNINIHKQTSTNTQTGRSRRETRRTVHGGAQFGRHARSLLGKRFDPKPNRTANRRSKRNEVFPRPPPFGFEITFRMYDVRKHIFEYWCRKNTQNNIEFR
jgi:hypothetical protein